jgi:small subunit ribosomal protein S18
MLNNSKKGKELLKNPAHPRKVQMREKECFFSKSGVLYIDYKEYEHFRRFVNDQGKILPRRVTGTSAHFQRQLTRAIKRARLLALMPFIAENLR